MILYYKEEREKERETYLSSLREIIYMYIYVCVYVCTHTGVFYSKLVRLILRGWVHTNCNLPLGVVTHSPFVANRSSEIKEEKDIEYI